MPKRTVVYVAMAVASCGRLGFDAAGSGDGGVGADAPADARLPLGSFSPPELVPGISDENADDDDPSMTADLLELFFDSDRPGGMGASDIYVARRASIGDPFDAPQLVAELSSGAFDSDPDISADGLTLYFNSNRPNNAGFVGIFVTRRATRSAPWSTPMELSELTTGNGEFGPGVTDDELELIYSTQELLVSRRASISSPWGAPEALDELNSSDQEGDPSFARNGLVVVFGSTRASSFDVYMSQRTSRDEPFEAPAPITELSTAFRDNDPWISDDLRHIVFSSTRGGTRDIYQATR